MAGSTGMHRGCTVHLGERNMVLEVVPLGVRRVALLEAHRGVLQGIWEVLGWSWCQESTEGGALQGSHIRGPRRRVMRVIVIIARVWVWGSQCHLQWLRGSIVI